MTAGMIDWRWCFVGGQFDGWSCEVQVNDQVREDQLDGAHPPALWLWEDKEAIHVGWQYTLPTPPDHAIKYPRAKIDRTQRKVTYGLEPVAGGPRGELMKSKPKPEPVAA